MRVVVFGSGGQGGAVLVRHLLATEHKPISLDRSEGFDVLNPGLRQTMIDVLREADAAVHLAVNPTPPMHELLPARSEDIAITCAIIEACIAAGVPRLVYGSSFGVDPSVGDVWNYYAASKRVGEAMVRAYAETEGKIGIALRLGGFGNPHLPPAPEHLRVTEKGIAAWFDWALRSHPQGYHRRLALGDGPGMHLETAA